MTRTGATICWGVAIAIGVSLPRVASGVGSPGRGVPVAQAPPAPTTSPAPSSAQEPKTPAPIPQGSAAPTTPAASPASATPAKPVPPPRRPLYERAWLTELPAGGSRQLTLTPSLLVISGPDVPMEARALADGSLRWSADTRSTTQPVVAGDVLLTANTGAITATDLATGEIRWATPAAQVAAVAVAGEVVLAALPQAINALRLADGSGLWTTTTPGDAAPLFAASATHVVAFSGKTLVGLDLTSGRVLWRVALEITPTAITVTRQLVSFAAAEGFVCAYRTEEGGLEWCFPVRVRPIGTPLADGKHLYVAFLDGTVRMFDGHNGARRRSLHASSRPLEGPRVVGPFLAVPLVTSEFVLFDSSADFTANRVFGFDPAESPPTLHAAASAADGSVLAMLMTSPATTSLLCLRRTPSEAKPAPAEPGAPAGGAPAAPPAGSPPASPPAAEPPAGSPAAAPPPASQR